MVTLARPFSTSVCIHSTPMDLVMVKKESVRIYTFVVQIEGFFSPLPVAPNSIHNPISDHLAHLLLFSC